ncbi:MAG TPA: class I tRNA ligase family protein [Conexibacter sp.]|nr:class I tRNA ligase family protein [Conexibacter sp.]
MPSADDRDLNDERGGYVAALVDERWQTAWREQRTFATPGEDAEGPVRYVFPSCPFTSGNAHLGHARIYSVSDAFVRFRRAMGDQILFSTGFDAFGLPSELEAIRRGITPAEWVEQCCDDFRRDFSGLGVSFDWERSFVTCEEQHYQWTQYLFLLLYEHDLIFRQERHVDWCDSCQTVLARTQAEDGVCWRCDSPTRFIPLEQWFFRATRYAAENDRKLDTLTGWDPNALNAQRSLLGRVEGAEVDAVAPSGAHAAVFAAEPDALGAAAFVAVSPNHPQLADWVGELGESEALRDMRSMGWRSGDRAGTVDVIDTGLTASVAGIARPLPVLVSPIVDARHGATASLGFPAVDRTDAVIGEKAGIAPPAEDAAGGDAEVVTRPATRYAISDFSVSRQRSWGAPIPIVYCPDCGIVPVPRDQLPVELPKHLRIDGSGRPLAECVEFVQTSCPQCGGPARRETDTLDCHVDAFWTWLAISVPYADRPERVFDHPQTARWLPVTNVIRGTDGAGFVFDQRSFTKMLRDVGLLRHIEDGEPFTNQRMIGLVRFDGRKMSKHLRNTVELKDMLEQVGADTLRVAMLYAAAPRNDFHWTDEPIRYCADFLEQLWAYAAPRLRRWQQLDATARERIDGGDRLRRKLTTWCDMARTNTMRAFDALEMKHAVEQAIALFGKLREFERRALAARGAGGALDPADEIALAIALRQLVQLLAPMAPHLAEELWALSGEQRLLATLPWPEPVPRTAAPQRGRAATAEAPAGA